MRSLRTLLVVAMAATLAAPALAAAQRSLAAQSMDDFYRDTSLGAVLIERAGTPEEYGELRVLADRGPKRAREAAQRSPNSAEAQFALGSWLLYGYKVVEGEETTFDVQGNAQTEKTTRVVQGLTDDYDEGLAPLKKAVELAPANGEYTLDYAAALLDCDRSNDAEGVLKGVWAGQPALPVQFKIRAGLMLSTIAENDGDLAGARDWVYSALSLDPVAAQAVDRLRELDAAEIAAAEAEAEAEAAAAESEAAAEEGTGAEGEAGAEAGGEEQPEVIEPTPSLPEEAGQEEGAQPEAAPEEGSDGSAGGEGQPYVGGGGMEQGPAEQPYAGDGGAEQGPVGQEPQPNEGPAEPTGPAPAPTPQTGSPY